MFLFLAIAMFFGIVCVENLEAAGDATLAGRDTQDSPSGTPFQHEAFNVVIPPGWKSLRNPEQGFEIGFEDGKTPGAKWYVHYEVMPKEAGEPATDAATLRSMASQFDTLVRQQFPGARKLSPEKREFPGKTLVHSLYELNDNGVAVHRRYVYFLAHGTAYVIQSSVPKVRSTEVTPDVDMLFRTFKPRPGAKPIPRTPDQALANLKNDLPLLASSMPVGWRPTIREIKFLNDTPKQGDVSLFIVARWPRRELEEEFSSAKAAFSLLQRGETGPAAITQATVDLVEYVGQLLGLAGGEVYSLEPAVTHLAVSMLDPMDKAVGLVRIRTKDLMRIISGDIQPLQAARLYEFESNLATELSPESTGGALSFVMPEGWGDRSGQRWFKYRQTAQNVSDLGTALGVSEGEPIGHAYWGNEKEPFLGVYFPLKKGFHGIQFVPWVQMSLPGIGYPKFPPHLDLEYYTFRGTVYSAQPIVIKAETGPLMSRVLGVNHRLDRSDEKVVDGKRCLRADPIAKEVFPLGEVLGYTKGERVGPPFWAEWQPEDDDAANPVARYESALPAKRDQALKGSAISGHQARDDTDLQPDPGITVLDVKAVALEPSIAYMGLILADPGMHVLHLEVSVQGTKNRICFGNRRGKSPDAEVVPFGAFKVNVGNKFLTVAKCIGFGGPAWAGIRVSAPDGYFNLVRLENVPTDWPVDVFFIVPEETTEVKFKFGDLKPVQLRIPK